MRGPEGFVDFEADKPREACGVFGVYAPGANIANIAYIGAQGGQNRGQDACGIAVMRGDEIALHRGKGLVSEVFHSQDVLDDLDPQKQAEFGASHTLYGTSGNGDGYQPIEGHGADGREFVLSHNGHLEPRDGSGIGRFHSDSYLLTDKVGRNWHTDGQLEDAIADACGEVEGAYSCVVMGDSKLIGFRDPNGIRPLDIGELPDGGVVIASETATLHKLGAKHLGEVPPGSMIIVDHEGIRYRQFAEPEPRLCVFEYVYFARRTSELNGVLVNEARRNQGKYLAIQDRERQEPIEADLVIGVPSSGIPAAMGYAQESGVPYEDAIDRDPYITRTFIKSTQAEVKKALALKLTTIGDLIRGKRVVVVDDSVVKGNTMNALVAMLWDAGAAELHLRSASPYYKWSCFYGMATGRAEDLLANKIEPGQFADYFGVDSFEALSLANLERSVMQSLGSLCTGCLDGNYPTNVPVELAARK